MAAVTKFLLLLLVSFTFQPISSVTHQDDVTALQSLMSEWGNTPPSWRKSADPCGFPWEGVECNNTNRVTSLKLSSMGLKGNLEGGDVSNLKELTILDLSFNKDLTGSISPQLGQLMKLITLMLAGCGFSGSIPQELGNLSELHFLALNSNKLTGGVPASLGNLSKLYWLDLSDNQLRGSLPVSDTSSPGLDMLLQIGHFHLNKNQLSGEISPQMFSSEMTKLIHVLLNGNQLTRSIPSTIGLVQQLEVLRLDVNHLTGEIPFNLNNLTNITEINLANNKLTGLLPNLTRMNYLQSLDLSNNTFTESEFPDSFLTLNSLMTLVIENGPLNGVLPDTLFRLPGLEQVKLKKNKLSGKLDMSKGDDQQLQLIDLQENEITSVTINSSSNTTLILVGNPVCSISNPLAKTKNCKLQPQAKPYSTNLGKCVSMKCSEKEQKPSPQSCDCVYPYQGTLYFNPLFGDLTNYTSFQMLENDISMKLQLAPKSVFLENIHFNCYDELQIDLSLFPTNELYFSRTQVQMIGFEMTNHIYLPPSDLLFGPYIFIADPYNFEVLQDNNGKSALSLTMILVISIGGSLLVLMLLGMFLIRYKKRNGRSTGFGRSFASSGSEGSVSLLLKGTRWFAYEELKKSTNNFSSRNEIGSGGYGKVYRGMLPDGQLVAIKRGFKQGSMQGITEFKTEIELLSRAHHKNLVSLIGFCFEKAEKILVYEFLPNGSLKDSLLGKSGIHLDWRRRLQIALGSARGLAYLHELANPPIIHRDVKSNNILLDDNLNAKVADFGLSKLLSDESMGHVSTQIKGTMGYVDPEYCLLQLLTEKSDVYSFGVVMLELLTAKQPIENGKHVVQEVRTIVDKANHGSCGLSELLDPALGSFTVSLLGLATYVELALRCAEDSSSDRPTMGEVVKGIEMIISQNEEINTNLTTSSSTSTNLTVSGSSTITNFGDVKNDHS